MRNSHLSVFRNLRPSYESKVHLPCAFTHATNTPTPRPSQQVERIREILFGRQMQSVEQRLDRLEARLQPMPVEFDDAQLAAALRPLVGAASMPDADEFERLIRAAFRRTLAEHSGGPFDAPDLLRRAVCRLDALFSSRSYEETVDEKMRRFRLEEIYLIDRRTLGLVSFASVNPSRHADARKVQAASGRLAALLAALDPDEEHELHYSRKIRALVRPGRFTLLAALVRGRPDPLAGEDLDYAPRRIENRFSRPLAEGDPLL